MLLPPCYRARYATRDIDAAVARLTILPPMSRCLIVFAPPRDMLGVIAASLRAYATIIVIGLLRYFSCYRAIAAASHAILSPQA